MQFYKCFNKGLINNYNRKYEIGQLYYANGNIKYGTDGYGFHVAKRLEDTLRFFAIREGNQVYPNDNIDIALVDCYGKYDEIKDSLESRYSDDYDMFAYEYMFIKKILSREEIIDYAFKLYEERLKKFIMYYKLNDYEKAAFIKKYQKSLDILYYISYYQDNEKDIIKVRKK